MPKLYIKTYGCQMNERDSEQVARMFVQKGYTMTDREDEADVILFNSCSLSTTELNASLILSSSLILFLLLIPIKNHL